MKKSILLGVAVILAVFVCAQDTSIKSGKKDTTGIFDKMKDFVTMSNGKTMIVKDGITAPLTYDIKLKNGTSVKQDGTVIPLAGKKFVLKEGQKIYLTGKNAVKDPPTNKKDSL
jgi:hypothetical protein